jgi:poly(A) polymerase
MLELLSDGGYRTTEIGRDFGTIEVQIEDQTIHITTYRRDEYDKGSRKPEVVTVSELHEDLSRRDFTINAIAYDPIENSIEDPFNGVKDLAIGKLKTPRGPSVAFSEDPLRMLRVCRFISKYEFSIDNEMFKAIEENSERLTIVSAERVRDELSKMLLGKKPSLGIRVFVESGLSNYVMPEINELKMEKDPDHHHKDIYEHTLIVTDTVSPELSLRLAALFHDIAKPRTKGIDGDKVHFRHHEIVGGKMTKKIMDKLRYDKTLIKKVVRLVELHLRPHTFKMGWTDSAVRRYIVDAADEIHELNELVRADVTTKNTKKKKEIYGYLDNLQERIIEVSEKEEVSKMRPPISGDDVMKELAIDPGPLVGIIMEALYEQRIDEGLVSKEEALDLARETKKKESG